jgi:hypothetical protein
VSRWMLQLAFLLAVKKVVGAAVFRFRDKDFGQAVQIEFIAVGIDEFLGGGDAVLFEHSDEQFGVRQRACVEKLHAGAFARCIVHLGFEKDKAFATLPAINV